MPESPATGQWGAGMKKMPMPVRCRNAPVFDADVQQWNKSAVS
jgi:hypothetical protein